MIWQSSLLMELIDAAIFLAALAVLVVFYNHRRAISSLHLSVQAAMQASQRVQDSRNSSSGLA